MQTAATLPRLATVEETARAFPQAKMTGSAIRALIFHADDRTNSRGDILPGNGLAKTGAIVRIGRKVLIDIDRFAAWMESHRGGVQ
jgi:hypothetical protein